MRSSLLAVTLLPLVLLATGCGAGNEPKGARETVAGTTEGTAGAHPLPQGSERVELDPANFVKRIDNPY